MALAFPESWSHLKHPSLRHELLVTLTEISKSTQKSDIGDSFDIDDAYHLIFDDTKLGDDAASEIGYCLLNEEEAREIRSLSQLLDDMLRELGDVGTPRFLAHSKWKDVHATAKAALQLMSRAGHASIVPNSTIQ
jgi:hypothetical protein